MIGASEATQAHRSQMERDVLEGFARHPRELPPRYFYDAAGSAIYDEITHLPEYYLTRAEEAILKPRAPEIAAATSAVELVELGPASGRKAAILLQALSCERYIAVDCSETALGAVARDLQPRFPSLEVRGIAGELTRPELVPPPRGRRVVAFLGSTIGNFDGPAAGSLLEGIGSLLRPDDALLLGTDLRPGRVKTRQFLELAYNDPAGVTERFNKNVLAVLNAGLGGDFSPGDWLHRAPYVEQHHRIEMHLVARRRLAVRFERLDREYVFEAGEILRTEISCKYDRPSVEALLEAAGLRLERWWTDPEDRFALSLSRRAGSSGAPR